MTWDLERLFRCWRSCYLRKRKERQEMNCGRWSLLRLLLYTTGKKRSASLCRSFPARWLQEMRQSGRKWSRMRKIGISGSHPMTFWNAILHATRISGSQIRWSMKRSTSKTMVPRRQRVCVWSRVDSGWRWRELRWKTVSVNSGVFLISWCQASFMDTKASGRNLKKRSWMTEMKKWVRDCAAWYIRLFFADWKRMCSRSFRTRLKRR